MDRRVFLVGLGEGSEGAEAQGVELAEAARDLVGAVLLLIELGVDAHVLEPLQQLDVVDELGGAVGGEADAGREAAWVARRLVEAVFATALIGDYLPRPIATVCSCRSKKFVQRIEEVVREPVRQRPLAPPLELDLGRPRDILFEDRVEPPP